MMNHHCACADHTAVTNAYIIADGRPDADPGMRSDRDGSAELCTHGNVGKISNLIVVLYDRRGVDNTMGSNMGRWVDHGVCHNDAASADLRVQWGDYRGWVDRGIPMHAAKLMYNPFTDGSVSNSNDKGYFA